MSTVCVAVVSSPSASMAARASRSTTRWAPSGRAQGARLATSVNSELAGEVELLVGTTEAVTGNPHRVQRMRVGVRSSGVTNSRPSPRVKGCSSGEPSIELERRRQ